MNDILPFVVTGIVVGALYGLAASGLVLTYKTSGIFNFAHGAIGAGAAYVTYDLRELRGVPTWLAFAIVLGVIAPAFGVVLSILAARLSSAPTSRRVVATVGVLLVVQACIQIRYGAAPLSFAPLFPTSTFQVVGVNVGIDQALTTAISMLGLATLSWALRSSKLGLRMRGVVDNGELLGLSGVSPRQVRVASWMIGSSFAALSGMLLAPAVGLDSVLLVLVVVQAFGAASIGRFTNINKAFAGGLLIGVGASLITAPVVQDNVGLIRSIRGLNQSLSFVVLFVVLVLTPTGRFRESVVRRAPRPPAMGPRWTGRAAALVVAAGAFILPTIFETRLPVLTLSAVFVTIFASMFLLVELSGQVSLCHAAFVAIGATTFSHLTVGAGLPWFVGVIGAGLVAVPVGAFVAIPAIRLSGLYLALATFGFGTVVEQLVYPSGVMFGSLGQRLGERPDVLGLSGDYGYFYLCSGFGFAAVGVVLLIRRSRLGLLLDGLADSPIALSLHGTSVNTLRVIAFCISAFMAGLAGALYVGVLGSVGAVGAGPTALISFNSLVWLAVLAFVGRRPMTSPMLAGMFLVFLPSFSTNPDIAQLVTVGFGVLAVLIAAYSEGLSSYIAASATRHRDRLSTTPLTHRFDALSPEVPESNVR